MKGTAGDQRLVVNSAAIGVGYSERGIGLQTAVFMPAKDDFDGATVYMNEQEAKELIAKIENAIEQGRTSNAGVIHGFAGLPLPSEDERYSVQQAMIGEGGGFVQSLGRAFMAADDINFRKLFEAFPEYWAQYRDVAEMRKGQRS